MKQGEMEAKIILEKLGVKFDEAYYDDNSRASMPDFRMSDGRYVEVTHTGHNQGVIKHPEHNKFNQMSVEEQYKCVHEAEEAAERIQHCRYEKARDGALTENGIEQYERDKKLTRKVFGWPPKEYDSDCLADTRSLSSLFREDCYCPAFFLSPDNVFDAIKTKEKRPYPTDAPIDLFIFAANEEYGHTKSLLNDGCENGACQQLVLEFIHSKFDKIYICEWNFEGTAYNVEQSEVILLSKNEKGEYNYKMLQY